jgi:Uma2 family endonuclease
LSSACSADLCVVPEPAVELGRKSQLDPDLVVIRTDQVEGAKLLEPPLLVVEVRSPSTALIDLNRKKDAYERFGVPSCWVVDPDPAGPEFTIFELRDGRYEVELETTEPFTASKPFPVSIVPASLTSRLQRD